MSGLKYSLALACSLLAFPVGGVSASAENIQLAQLAPSGGELKAYKGLHGAAAKGDVAAIKRLISAGSKLERRDRHGRTPLMVAGFQRHRDAAAALIGGGAKLDSLDHDRYDLLTISAVLNDIKILRLAIARGAPTNLVTSPYDGTALIAAAHLGHVEVVQALIDGKAPLDHVNNLNWTALIEAIVLGDGGARHIAIVRALISAGANLNLADGNGTTPLSLARHNGHQDIADMLLRAGARP